MISFVNKEQYLFKSDLAMGYFNIVAMLNTLRTYLLTLLTISEGYDIVNNITRYCESVAISKFVCVTE